MKHTLKIFTLGLLLILCSFAADWIAFQNLPGKFKISFPRQPKESQENVQTAIGTIKMKLFMYEVGNYKDDNAVYGVIYSDYPDSLINSDFKDEVLDNFFKNTISGAVKNMNGSVLSTEAISIDGYPGRKVKVSFAEGEGIMHMRIYLIKSRMYFIQVGCEKGKDGNASIDKFMNSFVLLGKKK